LEAITKAYLTDSKKTPYNSATDTISLISIMDWYGGDFKRDAGSVKAS